MLAASCFSGIGGAEAAFPEATWLWSAEVDPFANAVRETHFDAPNLGDVLADDFLQRASSHGPLDVLIGGPPCQDFSVAGLRKGLDGERGNLSLRWVQIINALRPRYAVTENVPGWLSVNRGHAFGAFCAGLVGYDTAILPPKSCGGKWTDAGMVDGPEGRLVWRVLDAQFFGLAQRRRRVFVVFCPRGGGDPAQVLLERKGVRGNPPPRREARQGTAPTLASRATAGGGLGTDAECDGALIAFDARQDVCTYGDLSRPLDTDGQSVAVALRAREGGATAELSDVPSALRASQGGGDKPYVLAYDVKGTPATQAPTDVHTVLRARAPGGSEASTTTVIMPLLEIGKGSSSRGEGPNGAGFGADGDPMFTLQAGAQHGVAVAFHHNQRAEVTTNDTAGALNSGGGKPGQGYPAVMTFDPRQIAHPANHSNPKVGDPCHPLRAVANCEPAIATASMVRRLTPTECCRLQGYPDDWLDITYRGKPAADGNKYRALGNSFAVPVVRWIVSNIVSTKGA